MGTSPELNPENHKPSEQLPSVETTAEAGLEQPTAESTGQSETFEAFAKRILDSAKKLGVAKVRDEMATAKVEYLRRSGEAKGDQVHTEAMAAVNALFADLEAQLQLQQVDNGEEPTVDPAIPESVQTSANPAEEPKLTPQPPSIDGVRPPEADKPADAASGGDDDDYVEETAAAAVVTTEAAAEVVDQYAERNAASQALLAKLQDPDLSIPGQSDMALLKNVRELLVMRSADRLAIRTDFEGNIVIGVPEDDGNGLKTRLMTLHHDSDQGTVDWLRRSMRAELTTLDGYKINVVDDPQLDHTAAALAA